MASVRLVLGDSHNFGRRVSVERGRVHKPRTVLWERMLLGRDGALRLLLRALAERDGLGAEAFEFLPDLAFFETSDGLGGEVEEIRLEPLGDLDEEGRRTLARIVGRSLALHSWLGLADLHWENLVLGRATPARIVFAPLDVEMILGDLELPTETKLLPDPDPEYAEVCRHACGVRRALPYLGKPVTPEDLVAMVSAYRATLKLLDRNAKAIADCIAGVPGMRDAPIRVMLRGTGAYVHALHDPHASAASLWPPLLEAEEEQLARGDIPYFFRLYGRPGIHYYRDPSLREIGTLPAEGDVPQLDPMLNLSRGLRAPSRKTLREEGMFAILGAFDHPSFRGIYASEELSVTFGPRTIVLQPRRSEELEAGRDLRAWVESVYLPCACGEVRTAFVPHVTTCTRAPTPTTRLG